MRKRDILKALYAGAVIRVEHINHPPSNARTMYRLSSNNAAIRAELVEELVRDHVIRTNNDGLPGIGDAQTYSLWRASEGGA
jgi:hypothetical protein